MNEFTVTALLLGFPGIICYFLVNKLIGKGERSTLEIILLVFAYSALSYSLIALFESVASLLFDGRYTSYSIGFLLGEEFKPSAKVLFQAVLAAILLAYILAFVNTHNIANRIGQKLKSTSRYGDEDVWHFFHNAPDSEKNDGWVVVRDYKADLSIFCYISTWSDTGKERELVLSDASVYRNSTGDFLYEVRHMYLSRQRDDLMIEVPPSDAESKPAYATQLVAKGVAR